MRKKTKKHNSARIVLRLPDLDFIEWSRSEPRREFNKTLVTRESPWSSGDPRLQR